MILIVSCVFIPEPVVSAQLSYDIAEVLSKKNEVTVISPRPSRPFGKNYDNVQLENYPFKHVVVDSYVSPESSVIGRFIESYSFGRYVSNFIKKNRKDISKIYINSWPLLSQKLVVSISKKYNIPTAIHIQDVYPESLVEKMPRIIGKIIKKVFLPIDKKLLNNADRIIAISSNMKDYITTSRSIDGSKIEVVRNWQNDKLFIEYKSKENPSKSIFTFMYLGSINPSANVELLIEAFGQSGMKDSKLIIAGAGPNMNNCISISKSYNKSNIEFTLAEKDQVPKLQSEADVLLLPLKKGMGKTASPSKFTAYLLSAKPVISCIDSESETANSIIESNCGFITEPDNILQLSGLMKYVRNLPKTELEIMGENGFKFAMNNLTKEVNLTKLIDIINEL